jgi:hypothetical protein
MVNTAKERPGFTTGELAGVAWRLVVISNLPSCVPTLDHHLPDPTVV